jgi:hypothetical protein
MPNAQPCADPVPFNDVAVQSEAPARVRGGPRALATASGGELVAAPWSAGWWGVPDMPASADLSLW